MSILEKLPHTAIRQDKIDPGLPKDGDAVVVLRQDGSSSFFTLGIDHKALPEKLATEGSLTDVEFGRLNAAQKAVTLYLISENEKIMEALSAVVNEPGFLGDNQFPI